VTRAVLKLAPLVFLRPGELSKAEWAEFDLDAGEWRIPGERMKMNGRHIVPLAWQAVEILRELHLMTDVTQGAPKLALARIGVGAPKLALARVGVGAPKLALVRVGVGAPKLALATYPSRLRLDVKASFDAPAIDPCVTSVNSQLPLTHYNNRTNKAHYIGRLKVKKGLRLFKLTSELIGTCHLVVKFDDKPSVGRPIKIDRDMAIRLYQALELAQARIRYLEQAALWQTEREGHHGIGGTAGRGEAFAPP